MNQYRKEKQLEVCNFRSSTAQSKTKQKTSARFYTFDLETNLYWPHSIVKKNNNNNSKIK